MDILEWRNLNRREIEEYDRIVERFRKRIDFMIDSNANRNRRGLNIRPEKVSVNYAKRCWVR
jgi:hypothetical protein